MLLRIPGLGVRNVNRLLRIRLWKKIRMDDLARLKVPVRKTMPFIETADFTPHRLKKEPVPERPRQLDFFSASPLSVQTGEL